MSVSLPNTGILLPPLIPQQAYHDLFKAVMFYQLQRLQLTPKFNAFAFTNFFFKHSKNKKMKNVTQKSALGKVISGEVLN